jgi:hypothetical protein
MSELIACPSCHRHARASEARCPFCGVAIPVAPRVRRRRAGTFGRAALIAASTTGVAAGSLGACSDQVIMGSDAYGIDVSIPDVHHDGPTLDVEVDAPIDAADAGEDDATDSGVD